MRNRIARLAISGAIVALVAGPLAGTAGATYCNPQVGVVCVVVDTVCMHGKLCQ